LLRADRLHLVPELERAGLVENLPAGDYHLPLPRLLEVTLDFYDAGVQVSTTARLAEIIQRHLTLAVEEILTFVRARIGESFAPSRAIEDLAHTLQVVDRHAPDAVGLLW